MLHAMRTVSCHSSFIYNHEKKFVSWVFISFEKLQLAVSILKLKFKWGWKNDDFRNRFRESNQVSSNKQLANKIEKVKNDTSVNKQQLSNGKKLNK